MTAIPARNVVHILEERIGILSTLRDLTRRRHEAVEAGRPDAVSRLVEARRPLIERLLAGAGDLEAAASRPVDGLGDSDPQALSLVETATSLLEEIEALDRDDDATLRRNGESTRGQLDELVRTSRAGKAYRRASGAGGTATGREQTA